MSPEESNLLTRDVLIKVHSPPGLPIYPAIVRGDVEPFSTLRQSVTKLVETLGKKDISWACFYLVLSKRVKNTFQWYPLALVPIQYCITSHKVCGHSKTTQQCQGGRVGGTFIRVPKNTSCQESVSIILLPVVGIWKFWKSYMRLGLNNSEGCGHAHRIFIKFSQAQKW